MNNQKEIWKGIVGHEATHEISNHGRVRSLDRTVNFVSKGKPSRMVKKGKIYTETKTHHSISSIGGKMITISIHDEMLKVFHKNDILCDLIQKEIQDMDGEIWKSVKDYEGIYEVSNMGRVRSVERYLHSNGITRKTRPKLHNTINNMGYIIVKLQKDKHKKSVVAHRLVAMEFIPNVANKPFINHINSIKTDNRVENLEWVNTRENITHYKLTKKYSSKYVGVSYDKRLKKYCAKCYYKKKSVHLGMFVNELDASMAYQKFIKDNGISNKYSINQSV